MRADIEDLRTVLGKDLHVTIPALNPANPDDSRVVSIALRVEENG